MSDKVERLREELAAAEEEEREKARQKELEERREQVRKISQARHDLLVPIADSIFQTIAPHFPAVDGWEVKNGAFVFNEDGAGSRSVTVSIRHNADHVHAYAWIEVEEYTTQDTYLGPGGAKKAKVQIKGRALDTKTYHPKTWTPDYDQKVLDHVLPLLRIKANEDSRLITQGIEERTQNKLKDLLEDLGHEDRWVEWRKKADAFWGQRTLPGLERPDRETKPRKLANQWELGANYDKLEMELNLELDPDTDREVIQRLILAMDQNLLTDPDALDRLLDA